MRILKGIKSEKFKLKPFTGPDIISGSCSLGRLVGTTATHVFPVAY